MRLTTHPPRSSFRPLRRAIPFACVGALLAPSLARAQAPAAPVATAPTTGMARHAAAVDAVVHKAMQTRRFPGVSVAVIEDGRVVLAKGYGLADVEKSIPATERTVYQLASVTKPFTAMATLMLVEDGKLSLDGKLTQILPGLPAAWAPVTVRHLLTHTSGIKSYTDVFGEKKIADSQVFTRDEILALVKDAPLAFTPGERFAYCNTGYYLLGMIIEKVSGRPYAAFLGDRIFKPLGMSSTSLDDYADARPVRARGYSYVNGQTRPADHTHPSQPFSAGALVSTVVDLAKWDAALSARKLLKPASYETMWTPMRLNDGKASTYAMGWQVDPYRGHTRHGHGGGISGFSTFFARFPDDRITVIALVNQGGGAAGSLVNGIAEVYIPALKEGAPKPITDSDPKTTAVLKDLLTGAARGEVDPERLTPEFRSFLLPDRIKQGPDMMGRHGPLQAFELMEDADRDGRRVRVYRATFGTTPLRVQFALAPDGRIAGLNISPVD
jgi:D-alanyl-D-alanine carboxypeptidase